MPEIYDILNRVVGEIDGASAEERAQIREQKLRELAHVLTLNPEDWTRATCVEQDE